MSRYKQDDPLTRLVNLAANLSRIAKTRPVTGNWSSILRDAREGKYFIEWTALDSPPVLLETLQTIQLRLCQIEQAGPDAWGDPKSDPLRRQMREWSDQLVAFYLEHKGSPT
ncbi:MAG: hypothetical protein AB1752_12295 [Candidatus Zixiibacteriota bacterium]